MQENVLLGPYKKQSIFHEELLRLIVDWSITLLASVQMTMPSVVCLTFFMTLLHLILQGNFKTHFFIILNFPIELHALFQCNLVMYDIMLVLV